MAEGVQALARLREAVREGKNVEVNGAEVKVGDVVLDGATELPLIAPRTKTRYDLRCIAFFLLHRDMAYPKYAMKCKVEANVTPVSYMDSKQVLGLLTGDLEYADCKLVDPEQLSQLENAVLMAPGSAGAIDAMEVEQHDTRTHVEQLRASERLLETRQSLLCSPHKDFSWILDLRPRESSKPNQPQTKKHKSKRAMPIILVPPGTSGCITIHNVKAFLEEGFFEPTADILQRDPNAIEMRKQMVRIRSLFDAKRKVDVAAYNDVSSFTSDHWSRVVAVIVLGKAWQFRPYTIGTTPAQLFNKVVGVHIHYAQENKFPSVQSWRVKTVAVDKHKRNAQQDKNAMMQFWDHVRTFVEESCPHRFLI